MKQFRFQVPSWATSALGLCGFTLRGEDGPHALACDLQVHGTEVHVQAAGPPPAEGDGLWTTEPGLAVAAE